jgi:hypothetical protein
VGFGWHNDSKTIINNFKINEMATIDWNVYKQARTATKTIAASGDTTLSGSDLAATGILEAEPSYVTVLKSDGSPLSVIWKYNSGANTVTITNLSGSAYANCKIIVG